MNISLGGALTVY